MPYVSPAAVVSGAVISKTTFGDVVKADLDYLASPPACLAYRTTTQAIVTATNTAIVFDAEVYDNNVIHDNVTNASRLTIKTAGIYVVNLNFRWPTNGIGERQGTIRLNGATELARDSKAGGSIAADLGHSVTHVDKFAVNDYLEGLAYQTTGGNLNVLVSARMSVTWIGLGT